ncbi:MAG TPA: pyridoxamine 5'-phosphate oxidase [Thermoanaerobaculia bacterium]|jgi:pyridoxamine 5'-phosphate oxidase|nr:pyridoxamine 5'-phosphate oxidase [Thermoanaerobaculia bacterium]
MAGHPEDQERGLSQLMETDLDPSPFAQFAKWFEEAKAVMPRHPEAATLATAGLDGVVTARVVLLKDIDARGFVFYTNYNSRKGSQIHENPYAALVWFWPELDRQVRVEGAVVKTTSEESDAYFASRPRGSQLGAWASDQSKVIPGRGDLDARFRELEQNHRDQPVPRPPHWGGYRLIPISVEFWQGRADRLHDRFRYWLRDAKDWVIERLAP